MKLLRNYLSTHNLCAGMQIKADLNHLNIDTGIENKNWTGEEIYLLLADIINVCGLDQSILCAYADESKNDIFEEIN